MQTKPMLSMQDIKTIAAACEAEALANRWSVTIAIVDDGGHLLWLQRLDGAAPSSAEIGPAKAGTAALGRRETRIHEEMINAGRVWFLSGLTRRGCAVPHSRAGYRSWSMAIASAGSASPASNRQRMHRSPRSGSRRCWVESGRCRVESRRCQ